MDCDCLACKRSCRCEVITEISEAPTIDPATLAPKWISVKDRLPSDERSVLAYYGFGNDGDGDLGMMFMGTLSYFCFDHQPHWQHESTGLIVTHWQPLPNAPKGE